MVLMTASTAFAQAGASTRPYRGLFGGGDQTQQGLTVNGAVGSGYTTNGVLEAPPTASDADIEAEPSPGRSRGSVYNTMSGGLSYSRSTEGLQLGASLSTSVRHYPQFSSLMQASHAGSIGASLKLTSRTTFNGSQVVGYQPWRTLNLLPEYLLSVPVGYVSAPNPDFAVVRADGFFYQSTGGLTQQITRRDSISAGYTYAHSRVSGSRRGLPDPTGTVRIRRSASEGAGQVGDRPVAELRNQNHGFESQSASLVYSRGIARGLSARLGYRYADVRYGRGVASFRNDFIDGGINYSRSLSLTRRTSLSFSTGAMGVHDAGETHYTAVGTAALMRQIGRTWSAALTYVRSVNFVEVIEAPVFNDTVGVQANGLLTRRLSLHFGSGATRGKVGVEQDPRRNTIGSAYGTAGVTYGFSRNIALSANYTYYMYSLNLPDFTDDFWSEGIGRHSMQVTLQAWAPLFQRRGRSSAAR
jgi:hypothetical protein